MNCRIIKKAISFLFFFLVPVAFGFSQVEESAKDGAEKRIFFEYFTAKGKSVISDEAALSALYLYESEQQEFLGGVQSASERLTFSGEYKYFFCTGKYGTVAFDGVASIEKYSDISLRTNSFFGVACQYDFSRNFFIGCEFLTGVKSVKYFDLDIPVKWKFDPLMSFTFGYRNSIGSKIVLRVSSRDTFYFPNFGYIFCGLGIRQDFKCGVSLKANVTMRTIDLMTISSNIDGWSASFGFGLRL